MKIIHLKEQSPSKKPFSVLIFLSLLGMISFAIILSVTIFAQTSIRLDEAQSLFQVSRDLSGTLYQVAQDVHVPGYHILLQAWTFVFGSTNISIARYLSLVFFIATIPAVYFLGKMVFGRRVGLFSALLITISPFMQWYGSEARMYSMLAFLTVIHYILFIKIFQKGKPVDWVLYTIVTIAGLYTH